MAATSNTGENPDNEVLSVSRESELFTMRSADFPPNSHIDSTEIEMVRDIVHITVSRVYQEGDKMASKRWQVK